MKWWKENKERVGEQVGGEREKEEGEYGELEVVVESEE